MPAGPEFDSRDESYSWILNWLSEHPYSARATQFSVSTTISRTGRPLTGEGIDALSPPIYFLPSAGFHILTYRCRLLWLSHKQVISPTGVPLESISISALGRSRALIQMLITEARHIYIERDTSRTIIFVADQYGAWRRTRSRPKRPLDTIVLDPTLKQSVIEDLREFLTSEQWYSDRGIPYRRGYLFYGSPGSGKTSFIYALAGELGLNIYVINLSSKGLTGDTLAELVTDTPTRCVLLIEDVDAAFVHREKGEEKNNVTFSGLLNAIDGVAAQEGRILCMTTNHVTRLDPALTRPGRIDVRCFFDLATRSQARELFARFYPHLPPDTRLPSEFAARIPEKKFSMAALQGFLMGYKRDPEEAVRKVEEWIESGGKGEEYGDNENGIGDGNGEEQKGGEGENSVASVTNVAGEKELNVTMDGNESDWE
ncbi:P-loop containing nucleoside triphosphate hydrolase protein [Jimgerdemannia flammicorona]|uniref:P-loop containing nucleoside triphosphate hydrolase protein n=1 Tax=Jimgerdemannia flammicorona TaxID=994334 RepID=A0A433D9P0_9FUNG|nr:P-loop containing nucleoside triphosphate hydrolase protein [Jimgerdemannia flammicorona]